MAQSDANSSVQPASSNKARTAVYPNKLQNQGSPSQLSYTVVHSTLQADESNPKESAKASITSIASQSSHHTHSQHQLEPYNHLQNHNGPPTVIHIPPKAPTFESKDAALKALQRKKRLQAWREKMKQKEDNEIQQAKKVEDDKMKIMNATSQLIELNYVIAARNKLSANPENNHAKSHTHARAEDGTGSDEATADSLQQKLQNEIALCQDIEKKKYKNVDSSRSNQPQNATPVMQDFLCKQHLQLLKHSSECQAPPGTCPNYSRCCDEMKSLWTHMLDCTNNNCDVKYCLYSRQILREYFKQVRQGEQFSEKYCVFINNNRQHGPTGLAQRGHDILQERQKPDLTNAYNEHVLKRRQLRVLVLEHASECTAEVGKCTAFPECDFTKKLWKHMSGCNDPNCKVTHCSSSRTILREHFYRTANHNIPQSSNGSPSKIQLSAQDSPLDFGGPSSPRQMTKQTPKATKLPINESTSKQDEGTPPKKRRHRLFQHRMTIPLRTAAAADSPSLTKDVSELSRESPEVLLEDNRKQHKSASDVKSKKKSSLTTHASLWDYDFDPLDSSDSEGDFNQILGVDVDIIGNGPNIWSKALPRKGEVNNLSLREAAAVTSRINDLKHQIRTADAIIQTTAPAYLVYPSKCWMEVESNNQETPKPIAVPASEKNHACAKSAEAFLSLFKSVCMKAHNNSNQSANHLVVTFLDIIRDARSCNKPHESNPYKLMKKVWMLIKCVTEPLDEIEKESLRHKLKKNFDAFLPQGYSMLSPNYFMYKDSAVCNTTIGNADFVQSCARTYLRFNNDA